MCLVNQVFDGAAKLYEIYTRKHMIEQFQLAASGPEPGVHKLSFSMRTHTSITKCAHGQSRCASSHQHTDEHWLSLSYLLCLSIWLVFMLMV